MILKAIANVRTGNYVYGTENSSLWLPPQVGAKPYHTLFGESSLKNPPHHPLSAPETHGTNLQTHPERFSEQFSVVPNLHHTIFSTRNFVTQKNRTRSSGLERWHATKRSGLRTTYFSHMAVPDPDDLNRPKTQPEKFQPGPGLDKKEPSPEEIGTISPIQVGDPRSISFEHNELLIKNDPSLQSYYTSLESRRGFRVLLGGTRHFGY